MTKLPEIFRSFIGVSFIGFSLFLFIMSLLWHFHSLENGYYKENSEENSEEHQEFVTKTATPLLAFALSMASGVAVAVYCVFDNRLAARRERQSQEYRLRTELYLESVNEYIRQERQRITFQAIEEANRITEELQKCVEKTESDVEKKEKSAKETVEKLEILPVDNMCDLELL